MTPPHKSRSNALNRRHFLKSASLAAGAMALGVPTLLRGANLNSRLNIATIGAMGKGVSDTDCCSSENIVALCDVDAARIAPQLKKYPGAKFYQDYRRLFDEMGKSIDAVDVASPDHTHAVIASLAMQQGKHVYCQKPLTQTIYESRYLRDLAQKSGVVTQMGNQGSAADGLRRAVECIQSGIIGQVREVHVWTNRPVWAQGMNRPEGADPIPDTLNWENWIGPAPMRPYKSKVYQPFQWRGWQDFGTGALGDMACHTVNMPFRALNLGYPTEIAAEAIGGINRESYPLGSRIRFQFPGRPSPLAKPLPTPARGAELLLRRQPATADLAPLTFHWYDGGKPDDTAPNGHDFSNKPPQELLVDIEALQGEVPNSACLIIGDKGKIFSPDDYGEQFFVKLNDDKKFIHYKKHPAVAAIPEWIPRNPFKGDNDHRHHLEWINAIKNNQPQSCYSRFAIGAQLTEIMLLGCVALRCGKTIEWNGPAMRATNAPEAAPFIKRHNRPGWALA
jgi:hypothetical protein